ncbi:hypothetical protein BC939DRAFT_438154 [Gamsiella multidivaricata]|uniref:uncharacterized protein n=1 Tax=Gamsiella multidivaricata TaxID=101098 RepID=UPI00221FBD51|nr:uncharacterized protein BC939DRAFT_438154 [Gamsiella multidivaricata]KAG0364740.1 hypothetical protein BGZ54_007211 [Gamsiella multidivaricata]KAI7831294.1 hypothetical protein BC939DRAFT_438154 [Gamsiella multidivaricata]
MRSFATVASFVAVAAFGLLAPTVTAQEYVEPYSKSGSAGGFKDSLNSLSSLGVGPYPSLSTSTGLGGGLPPMSVGATEDLGRLQKRQSCSPGYGSCGNGYCCPVGELCFNSVKGCCPKNLPWMCGKQYCCPYNSCLSNGHCGCNNGAFRCGNSCCKYGCNSSGDCGCPSSYPVDCGSEYCCPAGSVCVTGGKCLAGGSGGGGYSSGPEPYPTLTLNPTSGSFLTPTSSITPTSPPLVPVPIPGGSNSTTTTSSSSKPTMSVLPSDAGSSKDASKSTAIIIAVAVAAALMN